ncbi:MAG: ATP-binding protein [Acidobacteriota bacterium]
MFENYFGNRAVQEALGQMIASGRIPQTILLAGPEGVGKATLARRFAARLLGSPEKIEKDDLSLPHNLDIIAEREKWPADKRNDDPLLFATHPDFVTFAPDGPLRQISIPQMRLLKERAQFKPLHGSYRVFLIDQLDRANEQAANSLLKTLEEPPEHLILFLTAANPYDLLPTIRSRAVSLHVAPLGDEEMREFAAARGLDDAARRVALARGSPGFAVSLDLEVYDRRRDAMLTLLEAASGAAPFAAWVRYAESAQNRQEKLEPLLASLYGLLADVLALQYGGAVRNLDIEPRLAAVAGKVSFDWLRKAIAKTDELAQLVRRNIQKNIAFDAMIIELRG